MKNRVTAILVVLFIGLIIFFNQEIGRYIGARIGGALGIYIVIGGIAALGYYFRNKKDMKIGDILETAKEYTSDVQEITHDVNEITTDVTEIV